MTHSSHTAGEAAGLVAALAGPLAPTGITARTQAEVTALFGQLSLVSPGVVPVSEWRPDQAPHGVSADMYAALATTGRPP
jgi:hypothetical protein